VERIIGTVKKPLARQVCVEKGVTDEEIIAWTEADEPCGTICGWVINKELGRVQCADDANREHVVVNA
jgi:hypothetical protein